jgi:hypothetical protein
VRIRNATLRPKVLHLHYRPAVRKKNTAAANNDLDGHQFIISYAQFGRDSLFYMILGTEGWAAVIGLKPMWKENPSSFFKLQAFAHLCVPL